MARYQCVLARSKGIEPGAALMRNGARARQYGRKFTGGWAVTRSVVLIVAAAAIVGALGAGILLMRSGDGFAECRGSAVGSGVAEIGGPFSLIAADGTRMDSVELLERPTLLYFGYSFCPDFCPNDLARNALAADILAERGLEVDQVFVSIDPTRDTPEVVGDFSSAIHPDLVGLTGSPEDVAAAAQQYRVFYRQADDDPEYYLVDHSTFTYLVGPEHPFLDFFRSGATAEEVADRTQCFAEHL